MGKICASVFVLIVIHVNIAIAKDEVPFVDPYDVDGAIAVDPYDATGNRIGNTSQPIPKNKSQPVQESKKQPATKDKMVEKIKEEKPKTKMLDNLDKSWGDWKKSNFGGEKPPLDWSQVRTEVGMGFGGAFGGSVIGLFSGFILGSIYDGMSSCDQCWKDTAVFTGTLGASLGASTAVYMMGNNETQLGSAYMTLGGSLLPAIFGFFYFDDESQLQKSGFYIITMPLFATLGYNASRHYRKKNEKALFENIFYDDMWVSRNSSNMLVLNVKFKY